MLNKKGQEEAPFELLVAVVTMGFVLLIGLVAMNTLTKQKCEQDLDAKLEEFKSKLEIVINQKSPQSVNFPETNCYKTKDEKIRITVLAKPSQCADYCVSGLNICTLLEYSNSEAGVYSKKCLNISPDTVFQTMGPKCTDLSSEGKELKDLKQEVVRGNYDFLNRSGTSSFPTICAYWKAA